MSIPERKLRIAHVITGLELGGGGAVVLTIGRALDRTRFDMDVFCIYEGGDSARELTALGSRVELLPVWNYRRRFFHYSARETMKLAARLRGGRYDVVHTHIFQADTAGRVAARLAGIPVVVKSLHNMGRWKTSGQVLIDRLLNRDTDAVICCSDYQREVADAQERFPSGRGLTIHHGVDIRRFPARIDRPALESSLGLRSGCPTIGTVGRPIPEKGHEYLIEALPQVLRVHPGAQVLLVGEGSLRRDLEARLASTPYRDRVCFAGARPDIPEMMALMDVFVFPSVSEGFGIAVIEAMASGLPVVASDIRPLSEIVVTGRTGILVPARDSRALGNALIRLLDDRSLRARLGTQGRALVEERFTDRHMVDAYQDLYLRLHHAAVARGKANARPRAAAAALKT